MIIRKILLLALLLACISALAFAQDREIRYS